jgi:hypothetical protein
MLKINIILISLLLAGQVLIGNFVSTKGVDFADLNWEIQKLEGANRRLGTEIFQASSLSTISAQATKIGLEEAKTVYLSPEFPVALNTSR